MRRNSGMVLNSLLISIIFSLNDIIMAFMMIAGKLFEIKVGEINVIAKTTNIRYGNLNDTLIAGFSDWDISQSLII